MQLNGIKWIVILMILQLTQTMKSQQQFHGDSDYFYLDPEMEAAIGLNSDGQQQPRKYYFNAMPRSAVVPLAPDAQAADGDATTECVTAKVGETTAAAAASTEGGGADAAASTAAPAAESTTAQQSAAAPPPPVADGVAPTSEFTGDQEAKSKELHTLVQHLYIAQARVQLEATEIKKAQSVANAAQQQLEESANHVRAVTAALQNAQQEVAAAAIRAQTAQLQLAAHDQLLFAARQDVDALSSQMVGLQAAEGISAPKVNFDVTSLLEKLKQPLQESEKPTLAPPVCTMAPAGSSGSKSAIVQPQAQPTGQRTQQRLANIQDFHYD